MADDDHSTKRKGDDDNDGSPLSNKGTQAADEKRNKLVQVRLATVADVALITAMRICCHCGSETKEADIDAFRAVCDKRFRHGLANGELIAWLAFDGERGVSVGTAMLMVTAALPRLGAKSGLDARLRNIYVDPQYRRRGIGAQLTRAAIAEAQRLGVDELTLGTSPMGRPLYEKLGFRPKPGEMVLEPGALHAASESRVLV